MGLPVGAGPDDDLILHARQEVAPGAPRPLVHALDIDQRPAVVADDTAEGLERLLDGGHGVAERADGALVAAGRGVAGTPPSTCRAAGTRRAG